MWWLLACAAPPPEPWQPTGVPAAISGELHYVSMLDGEVWCDADIAFDGWATCPDCTWSYAIDAQVVEQRGREDCVLDPRYSWVDGWGEDVEPVGIAWEDGAWLDVAYDYARDPGTYEYDYDYAYFEPEYFGNERVDAILPVAAPSVGDGTIAWTVTTRPAGRPDIDGAWYRVCDGIEIQERDDRVDFGVAPVTTVDGSLPCGTVDVYRVDGGGALQVVVDGLLSASTPYLWLNDAATGCTYVQDRWSGDGWYDGRIWGGDPVVGSSRIGRMIADGPWDLVVATEPARGCAEPAAYRLSVQAPGAIALLHDDALRDPPLADEIAIEGSATWTSPVVGD